ncbi:MAG: hypothetical protein WC867_02895 [Candidatus Pacearchaeota archaeon]|jgi:hypothetical protein
MTNRLEDRLNDEIIENTPKKSFFQKIKDQPLEYLASTLAIVNPGNPAWALGETLFAGYSAQECFDLKVGGTILCFAGIAYLYNGIRKLYQKSVGVSEKTSEKMMMVHDGIVGVINSIVISLPMSYFIGGVDDPIKLAKSAALYSLCNIPMGYINGYSLDLHRDILGVKKSDRIPSLISNSSDNLKKLYAVGLTVASAGLTFAYLKSMGL